MLVGSTCLRRGLVEQQLISDQSFMFYWWISQKFSFISDLVEVFIYVKGLHVVSLLSLLFASPPALVCTIKQVMGLIAHHSVVISSQETGLARKTSPSTRQVCSFKFITGS